MAIPLPRGYGERLLTMTQAEKEMLGQGFLLFCSSLPPSYPLPPFSFKLSRSLSFKTSYTPFFVNNKLECGVLHVDFYGFYIYG